MFEKLYHQQKDICNWMILQNPGFMSNHSERQRAQVVQMHPGPVYYCTTTQ